MDGQKLELQLNGAHANAVLINSSGLALSFYRNGIIA
jgi:hypothetical protein